MVQDEGATVQDSDRIDLLNAKHTFMTHGAHESQVFNYLF